jgi:hypothetical protein
MNSSPFKLSYRSFTWRSSLCHTLIWTFFSISIVASQARVDFVPDNATWRYTNGDTIPPDNWVARDFDDSEWKTGQAPLGYGKYQLRTLVRSKKSPRPITTYFRTSFLVEDPKNWEKLLLKYKADDGALVHLNGNFISSFNMPNPPYDATTLASRTIRGWVPYRYHDVSSWIPHLVKGKNTIAISGHQADPKSSDLQVRFTMTGVEKGIQKKELLDLDSTWKYFDQRQLPDHEWTDLDYDDSDWKEGKGVFGYGNDDVSTVLSYGDDPSDKPLCTWYRTEFTIEDDMDVRALIFKVRFDDGIIIFINGREIGRHNLPYGYVDHMTPTNVEFNDWSNKHPHGFNYPAREIMPGRNVIALQIHGSSSRSPDMCMAMKSFSVEYLERKPTAPVIAKVQPAEEKKRVVVKVTDPKSVGEATPGDWAHSRDKYLEIAIASYEKGKLESAQRAHCASQLAKIFSREGNSLRAEIKFLLLSSAHLPSAQEYLELYSPYDDHPRIYEILNTLHSHDEAIFRSHLNLALAIALVYDQEPPSNWPHHQVAETILPRKLPDPLAAFQFWVTSDQNGKTLHSLDKLSIGELKYVVDTPATLAELAAAQDLRVRLSNLKLLYPGIEYSHERLGAREYNWPFQSYALPEIKTRGGICVDQAYYTAQVAKAYGVPAMMVSGAGSNGNHAWVGYLDQRERWDFETGRYDEAKFVTGLTFDPQTWQQPTDHELAHLTERFQKSPRYLISQVHTLFASEYLKREKLAESIKASELAIKSESRNFKAWDILVKAKKKSKSSESELQEIYADGAKTFSRMADLEAHFLKRQATSLLKSGDPSGAAKLRDRIISRNRRERPDIALEESKAELDRLIEEGSLDEQMTHYKAQIQKLKSAGLIAYYGLTRPYLEYLVSEGHHEEAEVALDYAKRKMEAREGSQLEEEFMNWTRSIENK